MQLLPADYVLIAIALAFAVFGIFRGFSGALAFLVATVASAGAGMLGWRYLDQFIGNAWLRGIADGVGALIVFGIVRWIITKTVHKLLAQPADAVFGFITGVATGILPIAGWAYSGLFIEYSTIVTILSRYVG